MISTAIDKQGNPHITNMGFWSEFVCLFKADLTFVIISKRSEYIKVLKPSLGFFFCIIKG